MKLKVLIGYNDKELDRYVNLGEIIEVTEARAEVLEKVKDYLGRNIVERIKEEDKQKKISEEATDKKDKHELDSQEDENQNPEKEKQESENIDSKNPEKENENPKNVDQKSGKNGSKNEEGVP